MARLIIDPIPRIEGHLKIEIEIEGGKVKDAWSSGTLFRGFEIMLQNRDPRDAWYLTQRICGVCPISHGSTSSIGLEDAFKIRPPDNGRIIRNLIEGTQYLHSHILWFYHLTALDYVDVVSALKANPKEPSLKVVQAKLKKFVESGQLGPFANGYWGHPAYKLPPDINLLAVAHYLEALDIQAKASHMTALLGGKMPMHMTTPPGGSTFVPKVEIIDDFLFRLKEIQRFIDNVYIPDVLAVAPYYKDWAGIGKGHGNYLAWGVFEDASFDPKKRLLPQGAIFAESGLKLMDPKAEEISEHVKHSWYKSASQLNPSKGQTDPNFTGYDTNKQYSWVKAPRLKNKPMEVGPLSRMLVAYLSGQPQVKAMIDSTLTALGVAGKPQVLLSVLGRIAARALETKLIADAMTNWTMELIGNLKAGKSAVFTDYQLPTDNRMGKGLWEAPRGALAHFNEIAGGKIKNYQCVVPSTWNASPRDDNGVRGPMEEALVGTPVADPKRPVELLRVVHSYDPCLACGIHVIDPQTNQIHKFRVC